MNSLMEDYIKLISLRNQKEKQIKDLLENYLDLSLYVINIIKVKIMNMKFDFNTHSLKMEILLDMELITTEDYYDTIGAYKLTWENLCVKKTFNKSGLEELAKSLYIDYNKDDDDDDVCERIANKIKQLTWEDFAQ